MNSDFRDLLKLFDDNQVRYLIIGGMAFIYHAEPRYTKDMDVWVSPDSENATRVYRALREFGAPLQNVTEEDFANSELFYQMGRPPARIDVLMSIPGVDFEQSWVRHVEVEIEGVKMLSLEGRLNHIQTRRRKTTRPTGRPYASTPRTIP